MEKSVLNRVFCFLREQGLVESESEFSRDWLARSECYLRSVRFKRVQPSVSTVAVCASKLHYYAERMRERGTHSELAAQFSELSEQCHHYINSEAEAEWLAA
jgi:hypothetical protein